MKDLFRHFKPLNSKSIIKTHSERIHTPKKIETRSIKCKFIKTFLNYVKNFSLIIVILGISTKTLVAYITLSHTSSPRTGYLKGVCLSLFTLCPLGMEQN